MVKQWDHIYKNPEKYNYYKILEPHESMPKISKVFKSHGVKKILDLGCGMGRNLFFLLKEGFEVKGLDSSKKAVDFVGKRGASACIGDIYESLPYASGIFDSIVSVQTLQHGTAKQIKFAIAEIERVIKPGGLVFITLAGRYAKGQLRYCLVKTAEEIAPHTFVPTKGKEVGLVHYIFNQQRIHEFFHNFKILEMWKDSKDYYCFLAERKSKG